MAKSFRPGQHHSIAELPDNVVQLWRDDRVPFLDRGAFERFRDLAKAAETFDVPLELAVFDRDYKAIAEWARLVGDEVRQASHIEDAPARFAARCAALVLRGVGEAFSHDSIGRRRALAIDSNLPGAGKTFALWSRADATATVRDALQDFRIPRDQIELRLSKMGYSVVNANIETDVFVEVYLGGSYHASASSDALFAGFPDSMLMPPTPVNLPDHMRCIAYNNNAFRIETLLPALEAVG